MTGTVYELVPKCAACGWRHHPRLPCAPMPKPPDPLDR